MSGTPAGAEKAAAAMLGMSIEDYAAKIDAGLKWCRLGQHWPARSEFYGDRSRADGLDVICIACKNEQARAAHVPKSPRKKPGPPRTIGSRRWRQENGR